MGSPQDDDEYDGAFNSSINADIHEVVRRELSVWRSDIERASGKQLSEQDLEPLVARIAQSTFRAVTISKTHQGPLPSPAFVKEYTEFYPSAAEEIFELAKREQRHRHDWENGALQSSIAEGRRRDAFAALLVVLGLGIAGYLVYEKQAIPAALLSAVLILGGGAIMFGREFIASHDGKNTKVEVTTGDSPPAASTAKPKKRKR